MHLSSVGEYWVQFESLFSHELQKLSFKKYSVSQARHYNVDDNRVLLISYRVQWDTILIYKHYYSTISSEFDTTEKPGSHWVHVNFWSIKSLEKVLQLKPFGLGKQ